MRNAAFLIASLVGIGCLAAACGGRSALLGDSLPSGGSGAGGAVAADGSATSGVSATGAGVGSGAGDGAGGGGPNPIGCLTCVAQSCPDVLACVMDQACLQGLACTVMNCVSGGSPDLVCV